ncbi:hypothetical protein CO659_25295 [Rhizobium sp. S9]|nr:hypothetical protein TAL182_CH01967 [Rhizobium sp. TAL182]PDS95056.1 hypothetical protein CO659_25295 [Rhizobium sp. S9]
MNPCTTDGPDHELSELLKRLEIEANAAGVEKTSDFLRVDHGKFVQHQFPTIDHETIETITYICVTTAALANFTKVLAEIVDKVLSIREKLRVNKEFGDHHREVKLEVKLGDQKLNLAHHRKLKSKLEKIASKQGREKEASNKKTKKSNES